jgi:hypothetical protein
MERTDRIWLITASVLVVLLLAGAGVLWWKRTETIARYSTTSQGELALAPMETSDTVLPPEAPKPKPKAAPRQPKGSEPGYLTRVRKTGSAIYVTYDPAAFLTGSEASLYAAKQ